MLPLKPVDSMSSSQVCQLNQYEEASGGAGVDIWRSTSDFVPVQSKSFGRVATTAFENLSAGCTGQGSRYPSLCAEYVDDIPYMHVGVSDGTNCQPRYDVLTRFDRDKRLQSRRHRAQCNAHDHFCEHRWRKHHHIHSAAIGWHCRGVPRRHSERLVHVR